MPRGRRPPHLVKHRPVHFKPSPLLMLVASLHDERGESTISHTVWHTDGPTRGVANTVSATVRSAISTVGTVNICRVATQQTRLATKARGFLWRVRKG